MGIGGAARRAGLQRPHRHRRRRARDSRAAHCSCPSLNGTIALDGRRVVFDSLTGALNGGALTLDGGFLLEGFRRDGRRPDGADPARRARVSRRAAERGGRAGHAAARTAGMESVRRHPRRAQRLQRDDQPAGAARRAPLAAARRRPASASWVEQLRLNLFRVHAAGSASRQQLRPLRGRRGPARDRHRRRARRCRGA